MAQISLLTTICVIGRIIFSSVPNVQPITAIITITTIIMGLTPSLIIATLTMIISNLALGMGPWVILQIMSYFIVILFIYSTEQLIKYIISFEKLKFWIRTIVSGFAGMLYGFVISLLWTKFVGIENFTVYYLAGLPFDLAHAFGNMVFFALLFPLLSRVITKHFV